MRFAILSLIGMAVLISPCVYDTDPREPSPIAAAIAQGSPQFAVSGIEFSSRDSDISTETMQ